VARVELHLEGLDDTTALAPAEAGTALLSTLQGWVREAQEDSGDVVTIR
jgi:hypothetical protein